MSEYNIQMNKYNALNVEYDQLYPATKIENVDGLDTALQNKAPAGYGLGEKYGVDITGSTGDANNAKYNGWYTTNDSTANLPTKLPYIACKEGTILTAVRGAQVKQTFFDNNYGFVATRIGNADTGAWSDWEYVNPPMLIGVEYRTTERYLGKPVYVKAVSIDGLPNNSIKTFTWSDSYTNMPFFVTGQAMRSVNGSYLSLPTDVYYSLSGVAVNGRISISAIEKQIAIKTDFDATSFDIVTVCVKYTKTTD